MLDKLGEHAFEVTLVSNEQPVDALAPSSANESFSEPVGTRRADRCLDDASTDRGHDFIEGSHELCVSIADQELGYSAFVLERHREVARLLGDPVADRMLGDTSQEHLAVLEIDEKQALLGSPWVAQLTG